MHLPVTLPLLCVPCVCYSFNLDTCLALRCRPANRWAAVPRDAPCPRVILGSRIIDSFARGDPAFVSNDRLSSTNRCSIVKPPSSYSDPLNFSLKTFIISRRNFNNIIRDPREETSCVNYGAELFYFHVSCAGALLNVLY